MESFPRRNIPGGGGGSNSQGNTYSIFPVVLVNTHVYIQSFTHSFIDSTNLSWAPTMCCLRHWEYIDEQDKVPSWSLQSRGARQTTQMSRHKPGNTDSPKSWEENKVGDTGRSRFLTSKKEVCLRQWHLSRFPNTSMDMQRSWNNVPQVVGGSYFVQGSGGVGWAAAERRQTETSPILSVCYPLRNHACGDRFHELHVWFVEGKKWK